MTTKHSAPSPTTPLRRRSSPPLNMTFYGPNLTQAVGRRERAIREAKDATLSLTRLVAEAVDAGVSPEEIVRRTDLSPRALAELLELGTPRPGR